MGSQISMRLRGIALVLLSFVFLSVLGCVHQTNNPGIKRFVAEMNSQPYQAVIGAHMKKCEPWKCHAFLCGFTKSPWNEKHNKIYGKYPSLVGATCADAYLGREDLTLLYTEIETNPQTGYALKPTFYSVGFGPGMWQFEYANRFANNSMRSITIFLEGDNETYILPNPALTTCYLDKGVLPIYVFYAKPNSEPNITALEKAMVRSAELMQNAFKDSSLNIGPVGPVIFVTDPRLNLTDPVVTKRLGALIGKVEHTCPYCMVAVGMEYTGSPRDYKIVGNSTFWKTLFLQPRLDALGEIKESPIGGARPLLLALGINTKTYGNCNAQALLWGVMNLTSYALHVEEKNGVEQKGRVLTIIPYVYLGEGKECRVSKLDTADFLGMMFLNAPSNPYFGIVLMNLYMPMTQYFDPLEGYDKAYYPLPPDPRQATSYILHDQYYPMFDSFFGFAHVYYVSTFKNKRAPAATPIVFCYGCNLTCGFAANYNIFRYQNLSSGPIQPFEKYKSYTPMPFDSSCLFHFPGKVPGSDVLPASTNAVMCQRYYPMLDDIANMFSLPPALLRAAAYVESHFDPALVIYQPKSTPECNPKNLNLTELFPNIYPRGTTLPKYYVDKKHLNDPVSPCRPENKIDPSDRGEECKPCTFGLTARPYMPLGVYKKYHLKIPAAVKFCDFSGKGYDPFDPADNLCAYAFDLNRFLWKKHGAWDEARKWTKISLDRDESDDDYWQNVLWLALFYAVDHNHFGRTWGQTYPSPNSPQPFGFQKWLMKCGGDGFEDFAKCVKKDVHDKKTSFAYDILAEMQVLEKNCNPFPPGSYTPDIKDEVYVPYKMYNYSGTTS